MKDSGPITVAILAFLGLALYLAMRAKSPSVSTVGDVTSNITQPPSEGLAEWIAGGLDRLANLAAGGSADGQLAFAVPGHAGRTVVDLDGLKNGQIFEIPGGTTAQWISPNP